MRSVLGGGGEYLQGLGNRIGTALSSSLEESDPTTSPSTQTSQTHPAAKAAQQQQQPVEKDATATAELDARRKLRFPRLLRYDRRSSLLALFFSRLTVTRERERC